MTSPIRPLYIYTKDRLVDLFYKDRFLISHYQILIGFWNKKKRKERMGRLFLVNLEGKSYSCRHCKTSIALCDDVVSKVFFRISRFFCCSILLICDIVYCDLYHWSSSSYSNYIKSDDSQIAHHQINLMIQTIFRLFLSSLAMSILRHCLNTHFTDLIGLSSFILNVCFGFLTVVSITPWESLPLQ